MAQRLKQEVRRQMLAGAQAVFAEAGYSGATMADIARRADVATGNLYRYFASKDELFCAAFPDELAESFLSVVRRRVQSLVDADDLTDLGPQARDDAQELLRFWIDHRLAVITLLDRAAGSRHEGFRERFIDALTTPSLRKLQRKAGGRRLPPVVRFTLRNVFENTVRTIVAILEERRSEAAIREAFEAFWSYQLAGLAGLERWVTS